MTLTAYIEKLQHIAKKYPDAEVVQVEYSGDMYVGNRTVEVESPTIGWLTSDGDFQTSANLSGKKITAVAL